ncbi:uncharacterized protein EI97DRAFT_256022 [Westerdykella ornata]|uniref:Uncharacterized protein n=1 Tax=Westerdykella ornata TaxID=318751 RepID=A0A6A6JQE4_WESOR|nr:uncharacterized protein EI97DRAFT_256022 [Westerdykella ornata]KAF2278485.1 hypothetical protein EI97DRAFT_256022 [Westerdykella ornata]
MFPVAAVGSNLRVNIPSALLLVFYARNPRNSEWESENRGDRRFGHFPQIGDLGFLCASSSRGRVFRTIGKSAFARQRPLSMGKLEEIGDALQIQRVFRGLSNSSLRFSHHRHSTQSSSLLQTPAVRTQNNPGSRGQSTATATMQIDGCQRIMLLHHQEQDVLASESHFQNTLGDRGPANRQYSESHTYPTYQPQALIR